MLIVAQILACAHSNSSGREQQGNKLAAGELKALETSFIVNITLVERGQAIRIRTGDPWLETQPGPVPAEDELRPASEVL